MYGSLVTSATPVTSSAVFAIEKVYIVVYY